MPTLTNYHWSSVFDCVMHETDVNGTTVATYTHEPTQFGPLLSETRDSGWAGMSVDSWSELGVDDWAGLPVSGPTEYFHHYDALGSTTALTNDTGAVTDTFQFDAWGNVVGQTGTTATPYRWVGRTGYHFNTLTRGYYVRAREYSPTIARWSSVDPLYLLSQQSAYLYALLTPTLRRDPSGLEPALLPLTAALSSTPSVPAALTPIVRRGGGLIPPWRVALVSVSGLTDGIQSYRMQWLATTEDYNLPEPLVLDNQGWLLTISRTSAVVEVNGQCTSIILPEEHTVDITRLRPNPSGAGAVPGPAAIIDISRLSRGTGRACHILEYVNKFGGINASFINLPERADWHDPPQYIIDTILRDARLKFSFLFSYEYLNPTVCNACGFACSNGVVTECLSGFWGEICNADFQLGRN